jgi:hypothetical protein
VGNQANWHVDVVLDDEAPAPSATVESVGVEIDLLATPQGLNRALERSLRDEGALWEQGVSCNLKGSSDMTCAVCPLRGTDERRDLCAVGVRQESLLARLVAMRDG